MASSRTLSPPIDLAMSAKSDRSATGRAAPPVEVPGLAPYLGPARVVLASGQQLQTFTRGLGRNRVALLVDEAVREGDEVVFELTVDGVQVTGQGRVERLHQGAGASETWAVVDFLRLGNGAEPRIARRLLLDAAEGEHAEPSRPRVREDEAFGGRKPVPTEAAPQPVRRRPKVERYAAPEAPNRWRVR
jgi:hypothetical protein